MTEEPQFATWEWVVWSNKRNLWAMKFLLKRYWLSALIAFVLLLGDIIGAVQPDGFGATVFIGWVLAMMFVGQDLAMGFLEVADVGGEIDD